MSGVAKLRYRPPAIQPMGAGGEETHHSVKRRIAKVEIEENFADEEKYARELQEKEDNAGLLDLEAAATTAVEFDPSSTQTRVKESIIMSNEAKYRHEHYPTIQDKLELHRQEMKKKHKEEMMKQVLAEKLRKMEEKRISDEERIRRQKKKMRFLPQLGDQPVDIVVETEDDGLDGELAEDDADIANNEEYKLAMLVSKERRLTNQRLTARAHEPVSSFYILRTQLALSLQLSSTSSLYTDVLPWLFMGRGEVASKVHALSKLSITHVLNVTKEVPNYFPATFVYQRIPIKDDIHSDASHFFLTAINFLKRVEACKGKVYVHCTVGASRAPTMVTAFFVAVKNMTLQDSIRYLQRKRPAVSPNVHFLSQLAELEVKVTGGKSSVLYDPYFNIYEFNETKKGDNMEPRKNLGIWKTTKALLRNEFDPVEFELQEKKGWG